MKTTAKKSEVGKLHALIAGIHAGALEEMIASGEVDTKLLQLAQSFLKDNGVTNCAEDEENLSKIASSTIELDESFLPKGHDFKRVSNG